MANDRFSMYISAARTIFMFTAWLKFFFTRKTHFHCFTLYTRFVVPDSSTQKKVMYYIKHSKCELIVIRMVLIDL